MSNVNNIAFEFLENALRMIFKFEKIFNLLEKKQKRKFFKFQKSKYRKCNNR